MLTYKIVGGRTVLILLTIIHLILPFTPVNEHEGSQIIVGALIIGSLFLWLTICSFQNPHRNFLRGLLLFWGVNVLAALTGASPLSEGWGVKLVFSLILIFGAIKKQFPKIS